MQNELQQWISISGRLLGSLFYYEPNNENVQSALHFFQQENWENEWGELTNEAQIKHLITQGFIQDLSEQYQRLFIGPEQLVAPPWSSVYLDPESVIFGNSLLDLRAFLRKHQIALTQNETEPEDHIGLMLLLAAYLAESRPALLPEYLSKHLLIWADHYFDLVAQQTNFPFYQGLALLARQTLKDWQQQLAIIVPQVSFYR
ncbi:Tat proofreading chaperone DmsD [Actinobacillus pleuropneumoniae]|uniref:Probable Tat proofreading chaperone DmsD n=1 Tax=Actinobacillus pleuropneumoniae serotype 7 (strain AP76) TaxID=537457 RepID=B3H2S2_ACTP7|nr:Tat proofreading chaperone DmsD [Actinobacillus pleuropneumoniae]ACE62389.1 hypothetical protein APP7_1737 [Actinobacillus pleuropneumoniae serovar 7 str. AP76]EFN02071.1 hypothetical protein appser13_17560 [Actinobacillus pleuropneumoniae serovar 13 str. N273]UKH39685.1 Tat proofreading chaperone DmsD [Actinobacillus pleuropneumoniae]UQZ25369.1 Tat proofreading chaperone DmsD [Actinobacillus pleuropneumoniae]